MGLGLRSLGASLGTGGILLTEATVGGGTVGLGGAPLEGDGAIWRRAELYSNGLACVVLWQRARLQNARSREYMNAGAIILDRGGLGR